MQELFCLRSSSRQAAPPHWLTHTGSRWTLSWCLWDMRAPLRTTTLNSDDAVHEGTLNVARAAFTP